MAQPSPSEFLTFYRHIRVATKCPSSLLTRPRCITATPYAMSRATASTPSTSASQRCFSVVPRRCFAAAARSLEEDDARKDEAGKRQNQRDDDAHPLDKDGYDVQSENAQKRQREHHAGTGGNATARRDELHSTERAKKEHPEAPDVVIGMQDERGQKGF
ncbi:uncharacterized protein J3D65DRAFT_174010 [Phyllosticta citribraziliensis]|uniref:Uncharacterized protein n=1 Tax=Phyllosticta citribraziliensis TaxID=989973 RepID=A0ABR1L4U0_9PEZI